MKTKPPFGLRVKAFVRWLTCVTAFVFLVGVTWTIVAWTAVASDPFAWLAWQPWICWLLTFIGADIYNKRFRTPNVKNEVPNERSE